MAGLYIHIPFCKKACHYCDFHFTQSIGQIDDMVDAIAKELVMQKDFLGNDTVYTIYFGGGTPSLLEGEHLKRLMGVIQHEYSLSSNPEVTLEGNPDDLTEAKLSTFFDHGINRLSIGVQSFNDNKLKWMNRQHTSKEAVDTFHNARRIGYENISLDLIYALPHADHDLWLKDLENIIALRPEHISSYCLTIEPKTAFGNWLQKGKIKPINEDFAAEQFEILLERLSKQGYDQYEISNFSLPGYESQHNSAYWKDEKYLGIGPSAHSYNGKFRKANVANNGKYLKGMSEDKIPIEVITLTREDQINEYLLTSLRTKWGCDLKLLKSKYAIDLVRIHEKYLDRISDEGLLYEDDGFLILTNAGKLFADKIASDLFI